VPRQTSDGIDGERFLRWFVRAVQRWGTAGLVAVDVASKGALYGTRSVDVVWWRWPAVWAAHWGIWAELNALRQVERLRLWITGCGQPDSTAYTSSRIDGNSKES
jgi:hypothetical protein